MTKITKGEGMFVGLTGNNTVGFGTANSEIFGRMITNPEEAGNIDVFGLAFDGQEKSATFLLDDATVVALGGTSGEKFVVGVQWGVLQDEVPIAVVTGVTHNTKLSLDGKGGVQKVAEGGTATNVTVLGVNTTEKTVSIKIV